MAANLDRAETSLTAVSDVAYIRAIDSSGNSVRISKADLASVLGGIIGVGGFPFRFVNFPGSDGVSTRVLSNIHGQGIFIIGKGGGSSNIPGIYAMSRDGGKHVIQEAIPSITFSYVENSYITVNVGDDSRLSMVFIQTQT